MPKYAAWPNDVMPPPVMSRRLPVKSAAIRMSMVSTSAYSSRAKGNASAKTASSAAASAWRRFGRVTRARSTGIGVAETFMGKGALDYEDPRTDPHHVFQSFKLHPFARRILEGGKMVRYGAKALPYGGWLTMPRIYGDGSRTRDFTSTT